MVSANEPAQVSLIRYLVHVWGGAGRHNKSQSSQQVVAILRTRPVGDDMISRDAQGSMVLPE